MDEKPLSEYALPDLLDAFASNDPVPGGGSAAALAGALGVSLLLMVAGLTKTRTGAPEEAVDLAETAALLRPRRDELTDLIDRDSDAYTAVVTAYRLPKGTSDEQAARREAVQAATRNATEVPLETMRLCQQAIRGAVTVARAGNRNAASDVGVALELLLTGLRGARMNVDTNLPGITDREFVTRIEAERDELERDAAHDAHLARTLLSA